MSNKVFYLSLSLTLLSQTACVSMSSLQTARTLKPGEARQTFGGGVYDSKSLDDDAVIERIQLPYIEYSYRQGVSEKWDAGLRLTFIGSAVVDAKYQILETERFALAAGLGLGYMSYSQTIGNEEKKWTAIDAVLPVYASYDFAKSLSIYVVPKYLYRTVSGASSSNESLYGSSAGFKIGETWGLFTEATYFRGIGSDFDTVQYNASFFWKPSKTWF